MKRVITAKAKSANKLIKGISLTAVVECRELSRNEMQERVDRVKNRMYDLLRAEYFDYSEIQIK